MLAWNFNWGYAGAIPAAADYNGDGRCDLAVYDGNTGNWFIHSLTGGTLLWNVNWGWGATRPVARYGVSGHYAVSSKAATGVDLQGEWVGRYYLEPQLNPSAIRSIGNLHAVITQSGSAVTLITTKPGVGNTLKGSIYSDRSMLMYDQLDGEIWSTYRGPVSYRSFKMYDFLYPPVPGGENPLQVIDLIRY